MEPFVALIPLTKRTCGANPEVHGRRPLRAGDRSMFVWSSRDPEEPVEPGLGRDDRNLFFEEQQKTRLAPRTCCCSDWRPTDLCATVLLSFQGTNTNVWPNPDRITDRTGKARRQSHGVYPSTLGIESQSLRGSLNRHPLIDCPPAWITGPIGGSVKNRRKTSQEGSQ